MHSRDGVIVTPLVLFRYGTAQIGPQRCPALDLKLFEMNEPRSILNFWGAHTDTLPHYIQMPTTEWSPIETSYKQGEEYSLSIFASILCMKWCYKTFGHLQQVVP